MREMLKSVRAGIKDAVGESLDVVNDPKLDNDSRKFLQQGIEDLKKHLTPDVWFSHIGM